MHESLHLLACYNILGAKPAGAGVGSDARTPLAHHKPWAIVCWAAGQFAPWLARWLGGLADGAPTTTPETRVLKRTVISIYGDRGAPCICEMLCSGLVPPCPASPNKASPKQKIAGRKKKEKKKEIGAAFRKSRSMMKMTCMVFFPAGDGGVVEVCRKLTPHSILSKPRCGVVCMVGVREHGTAEYMWIYLDSWSNSHLPHDVSTTKPHNHTTYEGIPAPAVAPPCPPRETSQIAPMMRPGAVVSPRPH